MGHLLVINGIIDEATQAPYYPEFAVNNTYVNIHTGGLEPATGVLADSSRLERSYGIKAYNDTVYNYAKVYPEPFLRSQSLLALTSALLPLRKIVQ